MNKPLLSLSIAAILAAPAAQAHHVWLERDGKTVKLQFGEFGLNQRETTPGMLDKFVAPTATLIGSAGERALTATKTAKGFVLPAAPAVGESVVAEEANYPSWETNKDGKVSTHVWIPAARLATSLTAQQPKLALDIVPTGTAGEFKVFYKGQPLPKAAVAATVPSGWAKEATTDEQGVVKFDLPWRGMYVLEAKHTDKNGGERDGKAYASASYVTSLTIYLPKGSAALPAGAALAPGAEH